MTVSPEDRCQPEAIRRALQDQVEGPLNRRARVIERALTLAQFVEELLRRTIKHLHKVLASTARDNLHYEFDEKKLDNMSLGSLIKEFDAFSQAGDPLPKELRDYVKKRNVFVHRALIEYTMDSAKSPVVDLKEWIAFADMGEVIARRLLEYAHQGHSQGKEPGLPRPLQV